MIQRLSISYVSRFLLNGTNTTETDNKSTKYTNKYGTNIPESNPLLGVRLNLLTATVIAAAGTAAVTTGCIICIAGATRIIIIGIIVVIIGVSVIVTVVMVLGICEYYFELFLLLLR